MAMKLTLLSPVVLLFLPVLLILPLALEYFEVIAPDSYSTGLSNLIDGGGLHFGSGSSSESKLRARPIGSLHELVSLSKPVWDERSPVDKLKLSSTRILPNFRSQSLFAGSGSKREHILVTGGFGSYGKHVVRDLLLLGRDQGPTTEDEWAETAGDERQRVDAGVVVTLLDTSDRRDELEFVLAHLPNFHRARLLGALGDSRSTAGFDFVDPRSAAFAGQEHSVDAFIENGRLRIAQADIRNLTALQQIFAPETFGEYAHMSAKVKAASHRTSIEVDKPPPPISGVIHLAGYSESECYVNPVDCRFVETEGARVLAALFAEMDTNLRPWLVSANGPDASSLYDAAAAGSDTFSDTEDISQRPGKRKRQPSPNQMHLSMESLASHARLHALSLRLPPDTHVVGDPFASRRLPLSYIVHNALGHLPVHVHTDSFPSFARSQQNDDWAGLAIISNEDVVEALVASAELLSRAAAADYLRKKSVLAEVDIVPPVAEPNMAREVVNFILQLTRSESPVSFQTYDGYSPPVSVSPLSPRLSSKLLGLKKPESSTVFLRSYLASMLSLQGTYLERNVTELCAPPPSYAELVQAVVNADGCFVQLIGVIDGMTWSFGCSQDMDEYAQPMAMLNAVPHTEGVRGVRLSVTRTDEGVGIDIGFSCPTGPGGVDEPIAWLEERTGATEGFYTADLPNVGFTRFHLDFTRRDTKTFTLSLPLEGDGKPKRKLMVRDVGGLDSKLPYFPNSGEEPVQGDLILELRLNEICCNKQVSREAHNFLREDPLYTSQIIYPSNDGFTSTADSTYPIQRCRSYRHAHDFTKKMKSWLESSRSAEICPRMHGEGADWVAHDLPLCPIDCSAPITCLVTERCRCPHDRCPPHHDAGLGPFPDVAFTTQLSYGTEQLAAIEPLSARVGGLFWQAVVLPQAWRLFGMPNDLLPRPHVVEIPPNIDNHLTQPACYQLDVATVPFSSDHIIVEALRERNAPLKESDFTVVPYYQGCYFNYVSENTYKKLADTVGFAETQITLSESVLASHIVIPFTHDWGSCTGWWPRHEEVLSRGPPPPMSKATAWQVNGDYSTKCIKSERDIVIPSRSKNTPALITQFGSLDQIIPSPQRKHLAFFAGGMRGFGAFARTRIGCGRTYGDPQAEVLYQSYAMGSNYLDTLNEAKFCLLPRGIPAWSTRTFEAIYAGCIPVFVADRNHFPFDDLLDYSRFSLTVQENEVDLLDAVLRSVGDAQLLRMQVALLKVREAFIYAEGQGAEWARKGPVIHSLISMAMRLTLEWPITDAC